MADHSLHLRDTNVLVALIRAGPLGTCIDETYKPRQAKFKPMISVVTVGELLSLARQFEWGPKKTAQITRLIDNLVVEDIDTPEILAAYGEIDHASRAAGRKMGKNDVWIAATARVSGATLLKTDRDFDHLRASSELSRATLPVINVIWIDPGQAKPQT